jgi:SAM-dependent methyltransferase
MSVVEPPQPSEREQNWREYGFEILRSKWKVVPGDVSRRLSSPELLQLPTGELVRLWTDLRDRDAQGEGFQVRGWYHELYRDFVRGKKLLDVGCGFGISSITFAQFGAEVTFVDIVEENVKLVEKVCRGLGLAERTHFKFLARTSDLQSLPTDYDVITAIGSLHNAPFDFMRDEVAELVKHLKIGGRWLQLAYPKARWFREGSPSFSAWGEMTDGEGTPYCEWYDLEKLLRLLAPAQFQPLLHYEWHNKDFNWFDLLLLSHRGVGSVDSGNATESLILEEKLALLENELRARDELLARIQSELLESGALSERLQGEAASLRQTLAVAEASTGWRLLGRWRRFRDRMAPHGTRRRSLYDKLRGFAREP